jgi:hypothetical protein
MRPIHAGMVKKVQVTIVLRQVTLGGRLVLALHGGRSLQSSATIAAPAYAKMRIAGKKIDPISQPKYTRTRSRDDGQAELMAWHPVTGVSKTCHKKSKTCNETNCSVPSSPPVPSRVESFKAARM